MKYSITAKLWIELESASEEDARQQAKSIVDNALYEYVHNHGIEPGKGLRIHLAKLIWSKENTT
jgi:hypothetical protein